MGYSCVCRSNIPSNIFGETGRARWHWPDRDDRVGAGLRAAHYRTDVGGLTHSPLVAGSIPAGPTYILRDDTRLVQHFIQHRWRR